MQRLLAIILTQALALGCDGPTCDVSTEGVSPGRVVPAPCEVRWVDARSECSVYEIEAEERDDQGREIAFRRLGDCNTRLVLDGVCTQYLDGSEAWQRERLTTYGADGTVSRIQNRPPSRVVGGPFAADLEHAGFGVVDYTYEDGRRVGATTDRGAISEYQYDAAGRLVRIEPVQADDDGRALLVTFEHDTEGRVIFQRSEVPGGGPDQWTTWETVYDDAGRITQVEGNALEWTRYDTYERDPAGRVVRFERRVTGSGPAVLDTTTYEYRTDGSLSGTVTVSGYTGSDGGRQADIVEATTFDEHGNPLHGVLTSDGEVFAHALYDYSCY
jgi:YD repeat-containing protein